MRRGITGPERAHRAPSALAVDGVEPQHVRARCERFARFPAQRVGAGGELLRPAADEARRGGSLAADEGSDRHPGRLAEPEPHDRGVAQPVAVRGDGREPPAVAGEWRAVAPHRDVAQQLGRVRAGKRFPGPEPAAWHLLRG